MDLVRLERFAVENGNDYDQVVAVLKTMEDWDGKDRRPMVVIGKTAKGYWPAAMNGKIPRRGNNSWASEPSLRVQDELRVLHRAGAERSKSATASRSRAFAMAR